MTGEDIVKSLMAGPASTGFTLTVPEGYKRSDIADAVEKATEGLVTAEQFLAASSDASAYASDYPFLESAGSNSLEGFLPEDLYGDGGRRCDGVVRMMLDQFKIETASLDLSYPQSRDMSLYDVVKLASVVEKEAAADNRATVASVFYNRLASDRPYLESGCDDRLRKWVTTRRPKRCTPTRRTARTATRACPRRPYAACRLSA